MKIRYFDYAATTPVNSEIIKEMIPYLGVEYGNPSSLYSIGRKSKKAIEESRYKVAQYINAKQNEIYFTSGGSESDNLAIKGILQANKDKGKHIITTRIEHPAVLNTCKYLEHKGYEVTYLSVDSNGKINLEELEHSIRTDTVLISIMYANNEVGTIEPIEQIGKIARAHNVIFHTDAVQAIGGVPIDVEKLKIDALSLSGHKIYAPKGVGALYIREGVKFSGIQQGGHQEKNKRAGTENVAGIVALGSAIKLMKKNFEEHSSYVMRLRDFYISEIEARIGNVKLNGDRFERLPGNANFSFEGVDAEQLLLKLDSYGICASAGSACTSGMETPSHVLIAMGLKENHIQGALRTTFGWGNTMEDVKFLVDKIEECVNDIR